MSVVAQASYQGCLPRLKKTNHSRKNPTILPIAFYVVEEETEVGSWSRYIALASYKNINNNVKFHNRKKNGVTRRVPLVEQGLLTFPNHPLSSPVFSGVHVACGEECHQIKTFNT
jgi:hypothetical protein